MNNQNNQNVSDAMTKVVLVMSPKESLREAYKLMKEHNIRHIPILENNRAVGILSDRDVLLCAKLDEIGGVVVPDIPVEEAMSRHPYVCKAGTKVSEVIKVMKKMKIDSILVEGEARALSGLITSSDLMDLLDSLLKEKTTYNIPYDFEIVDYRDFAGCSTAYLAD
mgnify:CR=1 FL=1|jgi:acetoin utilization protein AcuB